MTRKYFAEVESSTEEVVEKRGGSLEEGKSFWLRLLTDELYLG
jgi:hypothetical protein